MTYMRENWSLSSLSLPITIETLSFTYNHENTCFRPYTPVCNQPSISQILTIYCRYWSSWRYTFSSAYSSPLLSTAPSSLRYIWIFSRKPLSTSTVFGGAEAWWCVALVGSDDESYPGIESLRPSLDRTALALSTTPRKPVRESLWKIRFFKGRGFTVGV